jgi:hypothetical protein
MDTTEVSAKAKDPKPKTRVLRPSFCRLREAATLGTDLGCLENSKRKMMLKKNKPNAMAMKYRNTVV